MYVAYPGEQLRGSLEVTVVNRHGPDADIHVIEAPTWGDHETGYRIVTTDLAPGRHAVHVPIDRVVPHDPGVYYILVVASAEKGADFVASGTNWSNGRAGWNDGTDVAGWSDTLMQQATLGGYVRAPWTVGGGLRSEIEVGAAAVRVVVLGENAVQKDIAIGR
jgi:hypothetical protein